MSEPSASGDRPAATAAAEPPDEPPGTLAYPTGCGWGRRRSSPSRSPSRIRRGSSCRRNGPCARSASRRWRRRAAASPRGFRGTGRSMPRVQRLSFRATGTPASGPGSMPVGDGLVHLGGRCEGGFGHHEVEAMQPASWAAIRRSASSTTLRAVASPERTAAEIARTPGSSRCRLAGLAHGASPRIEGTRIRSLSTAGAAARTSSRSSPGRGSSGRSTFTRGNGCAVGGTSAVSSRRTRSTWSSRADSSPCNVVTSSSLNSSRRARRRAGLRRADALPARTPSAGHRFQGKGDRSLFDLLGVVVERRDVEAVLEEDTLDGTAVTIGEEIPELVGTTWSARLESRSRGTWICPGEGELGDRRQQGQERPRASRVGAFGVSGLEMSEPIPGIRSVPASTAPRIISMNDSAAGSTIGFTRTRPLSSGWRLASQSASVPPIDRPATTRGRSGRRAACRPLDLLA